MPWIETAHLPPSAVTLAAVGGSDGEMLEALDKLHICPICVEPDPSLDDRVSTHADLRLFHAGGDCVVVRKGDVRLFKAIALHALRPVYGEYDLRSVYPYDIAFNAFMIAGMLVGKADGIDPVLHSVCLRNGLRTVSVRQGYAKCSTALVTSSAAITADTGIAAQLCQNGVDCLTIRPGYIELPGYAHGFIGGATFLSAPDTLCFWGNLSFHPDADLIRRFCRAHRVTVRSLLGGPLRDVGSLIPLACR